MNRINKSLTNRVTDRSHVMRVANEWTSSRLCYHPFTHRRWREGCEQKRNRSLLNGFQCEEWRVDENFEIVKNVWLFCQMDMLSWWRIWALILNSAWHHFTVYFDGMSAKWVPWTLIARFWLNAHYETKETKKAQNGDLHDKVKQIAIFTEFNT